MRARQLGRASCTQSRSPWEAIPTASDRHPTPPLSSSAASRAGDAWTAVRPPPASTCAAARPCQRLASQGRPALPARAPGEQAAAVLLVGPAVRKAAPQAPQLPGAGAFARGPQRGAEVAQQHEKVVPVQLAAAPGPEPPAERAARAFADGRWVPQLAPDERARELQRAQQRPHVHQAAQAQQPVARATPRDRPTPRA